MAGAPSGPADRSEAGLDLGRTAAAVSPSAATWTTRLRDPAGGFKWENAAMPSLAVAESLGRCFEAVRLASEPHCTVTPPVNEVTTLP